MHIMYDRPPIPDLAFEAGQSELDDGASGLCSGQTELDPRMDPCAELIPDILQVDGWLDSDAGLLARVLAPTLTTADALGASSGSEDMAWSQARFESAVPGFGGHPVLPDDDANPSPAPPGCGKHPASSASGCSKQPAPTGFDLDFGEQTAFFGPRAANIASGSDSCVHGLRLRPGTSSSGPLGPTKSADTSQQKAASPRSSLHRTGSTTTSCYTIVKHGTVARCGGRPRDRGGETTPLSFTRSLTCEMSLRLLNIPQAMHECLGLQHAYPVVGRRRLRRCTVHIASPDRVVHAVEMQAASKSHHHRLHEGWRAFCEHVGLRVGDAIHFYATDRPDALVTTVTRAKGGGTTGGKERGQER